MLFKVLTLPIGGPIPGMKFIFNQILEMAERELYDEDRIREDLLLLQVQLEDGDITEDEYVERRVGGLSAIARGARLPRRCFGTRRRGFRGCGGSRGFWRCRRGTACRMT